MTSNNYCPLCWKKCGDIRTFIHCWNECPKIKECWIQVLQHVSDIINYKMEPDVVNLFWGHYITEIRSSSDTEIVQILLMTVKMTLVHNWIREANPPPPFKQWNTKIWACYVMARMTDSLKCSEHDSEHDDFIEIW